MLQSRQPQNCFDPTVDFWQFVLILFTLPTDCQTMVTFILFLHKYHLFIQHRCFFPWDSISEYQKEIKMLKDFFDAQTGKYMFSVDVVKMALILTSLDLP